MTQVDELYVDEDHSTQSSVELEELSKSSELLIEMFMSVKRECFHQTMQDFLLFPLKTIINNTVLN